MLAHNVLTETLAWWNTFATGDTGDSIDSFKTAIVVTAGGVISAGFAALAIVVPRHRASSPGPLPVPVSDIEENALVKELRRQLAEKDNEAAERETIIAGQGAMIERLRSFCYSHGLDPVNFRKLRQGETRESSIRE